MKKTILFLLICSGVIVARNSGGSSSKQIPLLHPAAPAAADWKGLELSRPATALPAIASTKKLPVRHRTSYSEVATKYSPAADTTVDRLVQKSSPRKRRLGNCSNDPTSCTGACRREKEMVTYILTLKN
jgi:hypothetical protein